MRRNDLRDGKAALRLMTLTVFGLAAQLPAQAQDVITFDNFPDQPPLNAAAPLIQANGGSATFMASRSRRTPTCWAIN